ncbi:allophanate hydrolase [Variibacter gotjawalensis]|uniref:Allophanate hydrolase n=1 Tax=Variibacter gotjawalensis TaxID=1333996 RepID=A0A0S3PT46_9BRAD|nr:allophanate hydrolase [Variibacter gotjawalensis]NIK49441.1 allophanate hydrolase [Variibacter gotjawalensis]RZS51293.1 allophanate hydrolase [Variibacter gotjawalensis]BAT59126.1 allophanate hydrolase [Variibacter gotjawalensis]
MTEPLIFADIPARVAAYEAGRDARADLEALYDRLETGAAFPALLALVPRERALKLLAIAAARRHNGEKLLLFGIPFAVKDNIDVAGVATTAACPAFAFQPDADATVVARLIAAGAIPVAKANLDQFATGLSGCRSPYGLSSSVFSDAHISGGSSSGSAVAVASGLIPFALGTDTAGSGRVPAMFNNLVGLKPTRGLLSNTGMVPACRTLDCVSIFAASVADAQLVASVAAGFDAADAYSRKAPDDLWARDVPPALRFGVVGADVLSRCSPDVLGAYARSITKLEALGGTPVLVNYTPFEDAARLLYNGPWVAERLAAIKDFAARDAEAIHPVVREIVLGGESFDAVDAFEGQYRLAALTRAVAHVWDKVDVLLVPTAPEHPTIEAMLADPIGANSRLGLFTNFVNLMDLAALAVPAGFANGMPVGVTLVGRAFSDGMLARLGDALHRADANAMLAATDVPLAAAAAVAPARSNEIVLAVVGAHLRGQPLNHQLTSRNARFLSAAQTDAGYSLYALSGTTPAKPGLARDGGAGRIELELWALSPAAFGSFVAEIPPPLGIGTLTLADGTTVKGFLCEAHALANAQDITAFGGWRAYLAAGSKTEKLPEQAA